MILKAMRAAVTLLFLFGVPASAATLRGEAF